MKIPAHQVMLRGMTTYLHSLVGKCERQTLAKYNRSTVTIQTVNLPLFIFAPRVTVVDVAAPKAGHGIGATLL